jgi:hypothetical protein
MADIQSLSPEQKLEQLTALLTELFTIQNNPALSLQDAFNAVAPDKFHGGLHKLVRAVAEAFDVPVDKQLGRIDKLVADICDEAEKRKIDTKELRALLPGWIKANDDMADQLVNDKTTHEELFEGPGSIAIYRRHMGPIKPEQKLAELTDIVTSYFALIADTSLSLTAVFNATQTERYQETMWQMVQGLAADFRVAMTREEGGHLRVDKTIEKVVAEAEKRGMDTQKLRTILPDYRAICDDVEARGIIPAERPDEAGMKAIERRVLELSRAYLNRHKGPQQ